MIRVTGLREWFTETLNDVDVQELTRAYVIDVLSTLKPKDDMHNESIVLAYYNACNVGEFVKFKHIGDWVLWADTFVPQVLSSSHDVVESMGRLSYYACHRILRRQWPIFEELADDMPRIVHRVRRAITNKRSIVQL